MMRGSSNALRSVVFSFRTLIESPTCLKKKKHCRSAKSDLARFVCSTGAKFSRWLAEVVRSNTSTNRRVREFAMTQNSVPSAKSHFNERLLSGNRSIAKCSIATRAASDFRAAMIMSDPSEVWQRLRMGLARNLCVGAFRGGRGSRFAVVQPSATHEHVRGRASDHMFYVIARMKDFRTCVAAGKMWRLD